MKLRIRGNSLRLRLTKSEVAEVGKGNTVEETVEFGSEPGQQLIYALVPTDDAENTTAVYDSCRISVFVPKSQAKEWARTNQTGIEAVKTIGDSSRTLRILIEKDFTCMEPRAGEDDADTFAHPFQDKPKSIIQLDALD
jgi:hypothetical protein